MVPTADLQRASQALGEAALDAARRGELHAARQLLLESTRISDHDPRYLKALGYSAFALGDIPGAYRAWKKAETLLGGPGMIPWVRSLEHGILRVTVERFNNALALVGQGHYQDALTTLSRVHDEIPDFVPAGKLKGLAMLAAGDRVGAHAAWSAQQSLCRDDHELRRLIASIGLRDSVAIEEPAAIPVFSMARLFEKTRVGAAGAALAIFALIMFWPRGRGESTEPVAAASVPVAAAATATPAPASPPKVPFTSVTSRTARTPPPTQRASFNARYRQGAAAAQRGEWARAIAYLGPVGELGTGEAYHSHVLALLAQGYLTTNRNADARRVARRLIQMYPQSPYITQELRTVAGAGAVRKP